MVIMFILSTVEYLSLVGTIEWKDNFFFWTGDWDPHETSNIPFKTGELPQDQSICMFFSSVKTSNLRFIAPSFEITTQLMFFRGVAFPCCTSFNHGIPFSIHIGQAKANSGYDLKFPRDLLTTNFARVQRSAVR